MGHWLVVAFVFVVWVLALVMALGLGRTAGDIDRDMGLK